VTQEDIDQNGVTMEEAVARVRACLHPAAVLVGQNILKDMQWLGLVQGQPNSQTAPPLRHFYCAMAGKRQFCVLVLRRTHLGKECPRGGWER